MPINYLKGLFDDTHYMAIGGVNPQNIRQFFDAGYLSVGLASSLMPKDAVAANDWETCEAMACLVPGAAGLLRYVQDYRMTMVGAESNLAIDMAKLGVPVGQGKGLPLSSLFAKVYKQNIPLLNSSAGGFVYNRQLHPAAKAVLRLGRLGWDKFITQVDFNAVAAQAAGDRHGKLAVTCR